MQNKTFLEVSISERFEKKDYKKCTVEVYQKTSEAGF